MIWFTSDSHFQHRNIIRLCRRPFRDLDEMHETIIKNWNLVVSPEDIVYFLGDFAFCGIGRSRYFFDRLNGFKIALKGNHDPSISRLLRIGFKQVYEGPIFVTIHGKLFRVNHYPYAPGWWGKFKLWVKGVDIRRFDRRPNDDGEWLIHGHTHSKTKIHGKQINVAVDAWQFFPVSEDQIMELVRGIGG